MTPQTPTEPGGGTTRSREQEPTPAELFEDFFGPSIFHPWTRVLLEHAEPEPGERVLDLACATGIVARHVAPRVGEEGEVAGVDVSPEMLEVARERAASDGVAVDWREGDATDLDLPDDRFDLALCQQGLQFFSDPLAALQETRRVLRGGGRIALNVWQPLERHPVYEALLRSEARHLDAALEDVATPFMFGDAAHVADVLRQAGFERSDVVETTMEVEFPQPDTFVALTVLAAAAVVPEVALDDPGERAALIEAITDDCDDVLRQHRDGDRLRFPMPNQIAVAYA